MLNESGAVSTPFPGLLLLRLRKFAPINLVKTIKSLILMLHSGTSGKIDQGGNGDCFFRDLSIFDLSPAAFAQPPIEDQSKNSGAWLRSQAVLHVRKHAELFGIFFTSFHLRG